MTVHQARDRFRGSALWLTLLRKMMFRRAAKVLVLSNHMRRALVMQGCSPEKLEVVRIGVDLGRFEDTARSRRECPDGVLRVLMVGRETDKKGFDDGLRACRGLIDRGALCEVTILGTNGPLRLELQKLAASLALEVRWPEPSSSVAVAMAHADVLLAPSRRALNGDEEGTPTVIVEAGAAGLPVVSTRHAGIPEQIEDGVTGLLCPERAPQALTAALLSLRDSGRRRRLGEAARAKMRAQYSLAARVHRLEQIYGAVLQQARE